MVAQAPAVAPLAAPPAPPGVPVPAPSPGMLASVMENPLVLPLAGVLVLLLAGLGVYRLRGRMRKSAASETSFMESRLQPDSFFGASGGQRVDTREAPAQSSSSSMSYSLSQLDAIGDVDPVAEADVYLAYGRDLQAEEILKEAMRSAPERHAIRVKLLEVYAKRRDTKGFELLATQLYSMTGGQGEDWLKAQELGRGIDPENGLYQPGGQPEAVMMEDGRMVEPLGASTLPATQKPASSLQPELVDLNASLDLDLDIDIDAPTRPGGDAPGFAEATRPMTTAGHIDLEPTDTRPAEQELSFELPAESGPGPLDLELSSGTAGRGAMPPPPPPSDFGSLDFDLDTGAVKPATGEQPLSTVFPEFEVSRPVDETLPPSDFGLEDPLARKLELAEEFRQIGDMEGARDLLEEVVAKSDGALKAKAQGMLDRLA